MPSDVSHLPKVGAEDRAPVMIDHDLRVVDDAEAGVAQGETQFGVLATVERALPPADNSKRFAADDEVECRPVVHRPHVSDGSEPGTKLPTTEIRLVERPAGTLAESTSRWSEPWPADSGNLPVIQTSQGPAQPVIGRERVVVDEGENLAECDGLSSVAFFSRARIRR